MVIRAQCDTNYRSAFSVEYKKEEGDTWDLVSCAHGTTRNLQGAMAQNVINIIAQTFLIRLVGLRHLNYKIKQEQVDDDQRDSEFHSPGWTLDDLSP